MQTKNNYSNAIKAFKKIEGRYDHLLHSNCELLDIFQTLESDLADASNRNNKELWKTIHRKRAIRELISNIEEIAWDAQRIDDESPMVIKDDNTSTDYYQLRREIEDFSKRYLV